MRRGVVRPTLSGTNPLAATSGLATFSDIKVDSASSNYTLTATGGGLTQATSNMFTISVGPVAKLGFFVQPSDAVAGTSISPQVLGYLEALGGNRVATNGTPITVAIDNNPGGGTLFGTLTKNTSPTGRAAFNNLSINKTGSGYTLQATSGSLTGATSAGFSITPGAADHLAFVVQPSNTAMNQTITPAVTVEIRDVNDNLVTNATDAVTLVIGNDPSLGTATLTGGGATPASGGVATFSGLSIDIIGIGYTLNASAPGLTGAGSDSFDITL